MSKMLHRTELRLKAGTAYRKWKIQMELDIYFWYCLGLNTQFFQFLEFQENVETPIIKVSPVTEEPQWQYEGDKNNILRYTETRFNFLFFLFTFFQDELLPYNC